MILCPRDVRFFTMFKIFKEFYESRPVVGSSRKRSAGLAKSSIERETLFFSPPESRLSSYDPIISSAQFKSPISYKRLSH